MFFLRRSTGGGRDARRKTMSSAALTNRKILLIVGGGIAAYKALELVRLLKKAGCQIQTILTSSGAEFVTPLSLAALTGRRVRMGLFQPD